MGDGGYSQFLSDLALCKIFLPSYSFQALDDYTLTEASSFTFSIFLSLRPSIYLVCFVFRKPTFLITMFHAFRLCLSSSKYTSFYLISLNISSFLISSVHLFNIRLMLFFSQISIRICYSP